MTTGLPFDDFRNLLRGLARADEGPADAVRARLDELAPAGSLRALGEIAAWLARASQSMPPVVSRPQLALFAGTHGLARHDVSARAPSWTAAMVEHCAAGGAAINQACLADDVALKVFDLALDLPTGDISRDAAFDERGCAATMAFGMEAASAETSLLVLGDFSVGGAVAAACVLAALQGGSGRDWVPLLVQAGEARTEPARAVIDAALAHHAGHLRDPLEALRRLGGREIAAIAGAIVSARVQNIPVILDGLAAVAAAAVLHALNAEAVTHCRLAASAPDGLLAGVVGRLAIEPVLAAGNLPGGGIAGTLAVGTVRTAALCLSGLRPMPVPA
ncbi:nicotinate-nucleotide--dimethylbenzimidazole phosphoribosyltransferase [Nitratireductor sp. StC3]|uniref:nicotinate-nucleotide--dimethylbenzimidazole phosphoribosyltransferase n=1 Tax=Nitratireductor sp. StC3 TaxID=2126741 RepID=UPI000D0CA7DE|nr:nicotinate-nucleotide--dimethylbenzimidazole phosphoribosyltransferase [Nitratireductor sp. StC3]PSM20078.1 nicotinate-nucleotide--dimethylbenzimidazole phosphoribosyltransferase [Nitratireductor sp. StC3]